MNETPTVIPIIMAGGGGVRFWPLSTEATPKQFVTAFTPDSLYQQTFARARRLADPSRILVMTNAAFRQHVCIQSPDLPEENIILEPCRRDTAPAVTLAASLAARRWPGSTMLVMPSDHMIRQGDAFHDTLVRALERAQSGGLGTVGIEPTYPATGYGYLHAEKTSEPVRPVLRFVEKPDRSKAQTFLASGEYLWNGGIFVWRTDVFLREVERFQPHLGAAMARIADAWGSPSFTSVLADEFQAVTAISVDFGIMEKASDVWTVPAAFDWNDIGGWTAAIDLVTEDGAGNRVRGTVFLDAARNNFVLSTDPHHPVLCVGVQDCIVVATPDGTLVCHRDRAEDLKPMVQKLLAETPARAADRSLQTSST